MGSHLVDVLDGDVQNGGFGDLPTSKGPLWDPNLERCGHYVVEWYQYGDIHVHAYPLKHPFTCGVRDS